MYQVRTGPTSKLLPATCIDLDCPLACDQDEMYEHTYICLTVTESSVTGAICQVRLQLQGCKATNYVMKISDAYF